MTPKRNRLGNAMKNRFLMASALFMLHSTVTQGSTVFFTADNPGTPLTVFGVNSNLTPGSAMVGLLATVNFSNSTSVTVPFAATCGANCGQATGAIPSGGGATWTLAQTSNTGSVSNASSPETTALNFWTLTNTSTTIGISSISLVGGPANGNVVFDRDRVTALGAATGGQIGSPNSDFGVTFSTTSTNPFPADTGAASSYAVTVTYSNIVTFISPQACTGAAFNANNVVTGCGDLWQTVTFSFATPTTFVGAVGTNATLHFFQDTDQIEPGAIPEPLTLGLVSSGLLAIAVRRYQLAKRKT